MAHTKRMKTLLICLNVQLRADTHHKWLFQFITFSKMVENQN